MNFLKVYSVESDSYMDPDVSLKGQFLIAMPNLADPNFSETVVCICEHTPQGAVGIVVNRPHPFLMEKDVFDELRLETSPDKAPRPIHSGGPVLTNEVFILHGRPFGWKGCLHVTPTLAMSNTMDVVIEIAQNRGPRSYLLSLGCSGWGPGQLDTEIRENVWLTSAIWDEIVFDIDNEDRWNAALKKMGIDPLLLSAAAGHA
jgi:putative transcriptional regulator